jgi:ankyrin repeat protein
MEWTMARTVAFSGGAVNHGAQTGINDGIINNNFYTSTRSVNAEITPGVHARFKLSDYEGQKNANPNRVNGTCNWFLQHDRYQKWRDSTIGGLLWVSGDPGCGKSVLSKFLIDHELRTLESVSICYFFFKDDNEQGQLQNALCGLLHQLFTLKPGLLKYALREFERNGDRLFIESLLLWRLLITAASDPTAGHIVCILDAVDECKGTDRYKLIDLLNSFYKDSTVDAGRCSNLKFLVTSRPYHKIELNFQELVNKIPTSRLAGEEEYKAISNEIELVIRSKVMQIATKRSLKPHVRDLLLTKLLSIPHQTYLWVYLIFEEIEKTFDSTESKLLGVIERLPESVYHAYERILSRSTNEIEARKILQIVIAATRPLDLKEMDVILAMNENIRQYNDLDLEGEIHIKQRIRNTCGLFLRVSDTKIYLIHQTAKEFLLAKKPDHVHSESRIRPKQWNNSLVEQDCDYLLAQICVKYLSFTTFETGSFVNYVMDRNRHRKDQILDSLIFQYRFLQYSATQWGAHVRRLRLKHDDEVIQLSVSLCDSRSRRSEVWSAVYYEHEQLKFGSVTQYTSLHLACLIGIPQVVRLLLGRAGTHMSHVGVENPLQIAAAAGHLTIVQILLKEGAIVDGRGGKSGSALQLASEYGHEKIVQSLLESGAKIDVSGGEYNNALHAACASGQETITQLLLENGGDLKAHAALQAASYQGYERVVQLLLDKGVDVSTPDGVYGIALQAASFQGHERVVQLLLDNGADINAQSGEYGNALQAASFRGNDKVVRLLLDNGADVNAYGGRYSTALQAASWQGHKRVVQLLLDNDVDINAQSGKYGTALQAASFRGNNKVVQLLLDKGANINTQSGDYGNALQAASSQGHEKVVQLLLEKDAESNAQSGEYGIAFQMALYSGHRKVVQLLLDKGADINAQSGEYGNALQAASFCGNDKAVRLLRDNGADVNAYGGRYSTALQAASWQGQEKVVQLLLDKGVNINAQSGDYSTALQAASFQDHERVVQLLLHNGADINAQSGEYGNALQAASFRGNDKVVRLLLDNGADVNAHGGRYGTALRAALSQGHEKLVQLLLNKGTRKRKLTR